MFLPLFLGCNSLAGNWSGTWICSEDLLGNDEVSEFSIDMELLPVSKYGFEGTAEMEGEVVVEDDGRAEGWLLWIQSDVRLEMTAFGGPQPLKVGWEDVDCSLTRGSEDGEVSCVAESDNLEGWEWTQENAIFGKVGYCSGLLER